jgi:hypothetical protein
MQNDNERDEWIATIKYLRMRLQMMEAMNEGYFLGVDNRASTTIEETNDQDFRRE